MMGRPIMHLAPWFPLRASSIPWRRMWRDMPSRPLYSFERA